MAELFPLKNKPNSVLKSQFVNKHGYCSSERHVGWWVSDNLTPPVLVPRQVRRCAIRQTFYWRSDLYIYLNWGRTVVCDPTPKSPVNKLTSLNKFGVPERKNSAMSNGVSLDSGPLPERKPKPQTDLPA